METQLRQAYTNVIRALKEFGLSMNDVLEEITYVTDMQATLTVGSKVRRKIYSEHPAVASTLVQVPRMALVDALVEIRTSRKRHKLNPFVL